MQITHAPGRLIRDPATGREINGPTTVPDNDPFWIRRLADGDVLPVAEAEAPATQASSRKAAAAADKE